MLSDYIKLGDRIELCSVLNRVKKPMSPEERSGKVYYSSVYEFRSEDELEVDMPQDHGKLVPLRRHSRYDIWVYNEKGIFQGIGEIEEYTKNEYGRYLMVLYLSEGLKKLQRREYYRFSCLLNMSYRLLTKEEQDKYDSGIIEFIETDITLEDGTIVDISGGGARCVTDAQYNPDDLLQFEFELPIDPNRPKKYSLVGRVVSSRPIEGKDGAFETRIQFMTIGNKDREGIVKYIFDEQLKVRGKENK
ncbi:MAG: PilZ domain-containing protein [Lachnospiraceae bacterium]|nr:PilZ domain-containing protein [Lachnospiraceae bacterium]